MSESFSCECKCHTHDFDDRVVVCSSCFTFHLNLLHKENEKLKEQLKIIKDTLNHQKIIQIERTPQGDFLFTTKEVVFILESSMIDLIKKDRIKTDYWIKETTLEKDYMRLKKENEILKSECDKLLHTHAELDKLNRHAINDNCKLTKKIIDERKEHDTEIERLKKIIDKLEIRQYEADRGVSVNYQAGNETVSHKFKVGDRVKVSPAIRENMEGTVLEILNPAYYIKFDDGTSGVNASEELVKTTKHKKTKFKVGDRVMAYQINGEKKKGTVKFLMGFPTEYYVVSDEGKCGWFDGWRLKKLVKVRKCENCRGRGYVDFRWNAISGCSILCSNCAGKGKIKI